MKLFEMTYVSSRGRPPQQSGSSTVCFLEENSINLTKSRT